MTRPGCFPVFLLYALMLSAALLVTASPPGVETFTEGPVPPADDAAAVQYTPCAPAGLTTPPRGRGYDKYVVLTTFGPSDPYYQAAQTLATYRNAEIIRFDPLDLDSLLDTLNVTMPRYVALVMKPHEIHTNFTRAFLMMSTNMDPDPFSDFSYGFITGATAQDALNFVNTIKKAEIEGIQDAPLNISGYRASSLNFVYPAVGSIYFKYLDVNDYSMIYLETNDTGSGVDFFHSNKDEMKDRKYLDIGSNGDPHMLWLFEGGNFNPNPPVWNFDPAKIEDPAYARKGLTSDNISTIDMYPAVVINGACHGGVPKHAMIEGDIKATFGDTQGLVKFHNMSDDFSFCLNILKTNITGYFAPCGSNNANDAGEDEYNMFRYHEPLGDTHKRSVDGVVMGCLGNRPNLRIFEEDSSTSILEVLPSGTFDPADWSVGQIMMLGGKSNRVYYGCPAFNPFKNDRDPRLNLTTVDYKYVNETTLDMQVSYHKPASTEAYFPVWDKFHHGNTRIYEPMDIPDNYSNVQKVEVLAAPDPYDELIHVLEDFDNKTILHMEADVSDPTSSEVWFNITFRITVPPPSPPVRGVNILETDLYGHALPGENATYQVNVLNTGEALDTILVEYTADQSGWAVNVDFNGSDVFPLLGRTAAVSVTPPPGADAGDQQTVVVLFRSAGDPLVFEQINITTTADQFYGVDILGPPRGQTILPGEQARFVINITNTGNGMDSIQAVYEVYSTNTYAAGWGPHLDHLGETKDPHDEFKVWFNVTAIDFEYYGANITYRITVWSDGNTSQKDTILISVNLGRLYGVKIEDTNTTLELMPYWSDFNRQLSVYNTGNDNDTILFEVAQAPADWTINLSLSSVELEPFYSTYLNVVFGYAENTPAGDYQVSVIARSQNATSVFDQVTFNITILKVYGLIIEEPQGQDARPGDFLQFEFVITNIGNCNDTYDLELQSWYGWNFSLPEGNATAELAPGQEQKVLAYTTVGGNVIPDLLYSLGLKVRSRADPGIEAYGSVPIYITPLFNISLECSQTSYTFHHSEDFATFLIFVRNFGDLKDTVLCTVTGDRMDWTEIEGELTMDLNPDDTKTFRVGVYPDMNLTGTYTYSIKAVGTNSTDQLTLTLTVPEGLEPPGPPVDDDDVDDDDTGLGMGYYLFFIIVFILIIIIVAAAIVVFVLMSRKKEEVGDEETGVLEPEVEEEPSVKDAPVEEDSLDDEWLDDLDGDPVEEAGTASRFEEDLSDEEQLPGDGEPALEDMDLHLPDDDLGGDELYEFDSDFMDDEWDDDGEDDF